MKVIKLIFPFFILLNLLLAGFCAAEDSKRTLLQERKARISSLGFSFIPPPGENWYEDFRETSIMYLKKTDLTKYTFFASANEYHTKMVFTSPEKYLNFIKNKKGMIDKDNSPRFKNSHGSYKLVPSLSPLCVHYEEHFEDHGENNLNGKKFKIVENIGLICLHPGNPTVGVEIYYSEGYSENEQNQTFRNEGEEFINSLKFLPFNQILESGEWGRVILKSSV